MFYLHNIYYIVCVYTHTHICIRTNGKCSFERPKGKFSAELGSFQASGSWGPFLLMFGLSPAGWAVSLLSFNK